MITAITILQILVLIGLFVELLYVAFNKPSRVQTIMALLLASTIVMLLGYTIEITAKSEETALIGAGVAYVGKPFALICSLLVVAEYCRVKIKKIIEIPLIVVSTIFPFLVFTNNYHHLYYSTVVFDDSRYFTPLALGHGPLYYLYMAEIFIVFASILVIFLKELATNKSSDSKKRLWLLFGIIASTIVGYVIYLLGLTEGYDTTMVGTVVGVGFLSVLFFKYRLFDHLLLAKEKSLNNAITGLLVVDNESGVIYKNNMISQILDSGISIEELLAQPEGESLLELGSKFYEVKNELVIENNQLYGRTIQVNDITTKHNYSRQLEAEIALRTQEIIHIQRSIVSSFAGIVEARDNNTGAHIIRMSKYVEIIAEELYKHGDYPAVINEKFIRSLVDVAPLHDIGKICIPDAILLKPGKLTPEERAIIKTHTTEGARVIDQCLSGVESEEYVRLAKDVALNHHERFDGTGYPNGVSGSNIPLEARIVSVADVYDALRSERCYKVSMGKLEAKRTIIEGKGTHFDPFVVDAFVRAIDKIESVI